MRTQFAVIAIGLFLASSAQAQFANRPQVSNSVPVEIVRLTNIERARHGLAPVRMHTQLNLAASRHADTMARLGVMCHQAGGTTLSSRIQGTGYVYSACAENIAHNQSSAREVVGDWMQSPGHRANILTPSYTHIGVHVTRDQRGQAYYCQVFGQPMYSGR